MRGHRKVDAAAACFFEYADTQKIQLLIVGDLSARLQDRAFGIRRRHHQGADWLSVVIRDHRGVDRAGHPEKIEEECELVGGERCRTPMTRECGVPGMLEIADPARCRYVPQRDDLETDAAARFERAFVTRDQVVRYFNLIVNP